MTDTALIGYSGFVGSNILRFEKFSHLYNSKNIEEIQRQKFSRIVCSAAPSVKWLANKEPEKDWQSISRLIENLKTVKAEHLVLISTIDVYPEVNGVDEDTPIDIARSMPYSKHRRELEIFVQERFNSTIIRLPGVFGPGLKKNPIYDLQQKNLHYLNPKGVFQFYNLDYIWRDIGIALDNSLELVNFAVEPTPIKDISEQIFAVELDSNTDKPSASYDMRTKHSRFWNNRGSYLYSRESVIEDIRKFIDKTNCEKSV